MYRNNVFERHQLHHYEWKLLVCCGSYLVSSWSKEEKENPVVVEGFGGETGAPNTKSIA